MGGDEIFREIESRIVWFAALLVESRGNSIASATKAADAALGEYQQRFPPLKLPGE